MIHGGYNYLITLAVMVFFCYKGLGQSSEVELKDSLKNAGVNEKIEITYKLGKYYRHRNSDSALSYFTQSGTISEISNQHNHYARAQIGLIRIKLNQGLLEEAEDNMQSLIDYCIKNRLPIQEAQTRILTCVGLEKMGLHRESLEVLKEALKVFQQANDEDLMMRTHTNISVQYAELNLLDSAMYHIDRAIRYKKKNNDLHTAVPDAGNIALMLMNAQDYESSEMYLNKAWQWLDSSDFRLHIWMTTITGIYFRETGQLDSAFNYGSRGWKMVSENPSLPYHTCDIGMLYTDLLIRKNMFDSAVVVAQKGLETALKHENLQLVSSMFLRLAEAYMALGKWEKSMQHIRLGKEYAQNHHNSDNLIWAENVLYRLYEKQGMYHQALSTFKSLNALEDSIANIKKNQSILALERKYKSAQLSEELIMQQLKLAKQEATQKNILFLTTCFILALAGGIWWWNSRRQLEIKRKELQLETEKQKNDYLKNISEMKSNFFTNISHELRTPLSLILAPIEDALLKNDKIYSDVNLPAKNARIIQRNAKRLITLVDQILDLSKLDSGDLKIFVQVGNIVKFIQILFLSFESLAKSRGIEIDITVETEKTVGFFDPDKLEKIVTNLITNAIKYTPEGGKVSLVILIQNGYLYLQIKDEGGGMTEEQIERIFDRYYQAGNIDGTGVGLTLVKELTTLYEGSIAVYSNVGVGSIFSLKLPISRQRLEPMSQVLFVEGDVYDSALKSMSWMLPKEDDYIESTAAIRDEFDTILIVEDNTELLAYIANILSNEYRIFQASNGQKGYDLALEFVPDLIISDVMMPLIDGVELCQQIKSNTRTSHIPVILLTAKVGQEAKMVGLKAGADEYITKPFQIEEMRIRVRNHMNQRKVLKRKYNLESHMKPNKIEVDSLEDRFLENVKRTVECFYSQDDFTVKKLADSVGFSRSQLHRKMKALIDVSPNEFIRNFRLIRARDLLTQHSGSISEIAYAVGFSNLSYFTKTYKEYFNELPTDTIEES